VMRDKDAPAIARPLFAAARRIVLAVPDTDRAATLDELARTLGPLSEGAERASSPREGLERLLGGAAGDVVVAGSLYLVGEVRQALLERREGRAIA